MYTACRETPRKDIEISNLHGATIIAFHNIGDNHPSIVRMSEIYGLDADNHIQYCSNDILLVK